MPAKAIEVCSRPAREGATDDGSLAAGLTLRPFEESDQEGFLAALRSSRASIGRWLPLNRLGESDEAFFARQLRLCHEGDASGKSYRRLGRLADGRIAGMFALNSISRGLTWEADAVWWIGDDLRGLGLATAGVRRLLAHAFADLPTGLGLHGVHCGIEAENLASVRVAEKCGFVHDAAKRSHLRIGDRWAMHEFYLATPDRFFALSEA